jgi:hypothetical protein
VVDIQNRLSIESLTPCIDDSLRATSSLPAKAMRNCARKLRPSLPEFWVFLAAQFLFCSVDAQVFPIMAKEPQAWSAGEHYPSEHIERSIDGQQATQSAIARAIARSAKKGFIENGVEESTKALIDCQKETSNTLAMPFGRGESQQAHCYRF